MATVSEMLVTDWWGPCLPEEMLEQAWALESKDLRLPRVCSEEPTRDPLELADLFGRPLTPAEMAGAAYAYCREEQIEGCYFHSPDPLPPVVPLPVPGSLLIAALVALAFTKSRTRILWRKSK